MQSKLCASCNIILVATIGYKYKVDETGFMRSGDIEIYIGYT